LIEFLNQFSRTFGCRKEHRERQNTTIKSCGAKWSMGSYVFATDWMRKQIAASRPESAH